MRTTQLHSLSLLTGPAVALLAFVVMGQQIQDLLQHSPAPAPISYTDYVYITNNDTGAADYVVPTGKVLIITGVLNRLTSGFARVQVGSMGNWTTVYSSSVSSALDSTESATRALQTGPVRGYPVGAGEEVRNQPGTTPHQLWIVGYLVDA